jgi:NADPH:quinone reductase-like Zn-dependent oxidoreductase
MSPKHNKALYATEDGQFVIRDDLHHESVAPDEMLVETRYSGVNPADIRHSTLLGIWGTVLGYDFAGRVLKASPTSEFKEGDIVAGCTPTGLGRPAKHGTHQSHFVAPCNMAFKIPSNMPEAHAAVLTVVFMTAADVVHNRFKFPLPTAPGNFSGPILIWGGSSSIGLCALQLARASGCKNIIVTASPARHDLLKSLGATHTFDYSSATVEQEIKSAVEALGKGPITHALDTAASIGEPSSADLMAKCTSESTVLCSCIIRDDSRFLFPGAILKNPWTMRYAGSPETTIIPPRPADHWNAWAAPQWAIANYGTNFKLPSVRVLDVTAEEALKELFLSESGKHGYGKVVFRHPLR